MTAALLQGIVLALGAMLVGAGIGAAVGVSRFGYRLRRWCA